MKNSTLVKYTLLSILATLFIAAGIAGGMLERSVEFKEQLSFFECLHPVLIDYWKIFLAIGLVIGAGNFILNIKNRR